MQQKVNDEFHVSPFFPNFLNARRIDRVKAFAYFCIILWGPEHILVQISGGDIESALKASNTLTKILVAIILVLPGFVPLACFLIVAPVVYAFAWPKWAMDPEWRNIKGAAFKR